MYARLDRWEDAEKAFRRALKEHPNYWLAYNELGFGLHGQAKYQEAIQAFHAASLAAPKNSMSLSNLGVEYLQIGEFTEGLKSVKQSLALDPESSFAAANVSLALRYQEKYEQALPFARKSVQLNPAQDTNWLELADCLFFSGSIGMRETLICGPRRKPNATCSQTLRMAPAGCCSLSTRPCQGARKKLPC